MKDNLKHKDIEQGLKSASKEMILSKKDLPLNIVYKGKRYILILTKNDKLILNKSTD